MQCAEDLLHIGDHRFDLDNEQSPRSRVEGEEIDTAPVAVAVEADLGRHCPTQCLQLADQLLAQPSMIGVSQPRQLRASVPSVPGHGQVQTGSDAPDGSDSEALCLSPLEQADESSTDSGTPGEIHLAQSPAVSQRPDRGAQGSVVHGRDAGAGCLPADYCGVALGAGAAADAADAAAALRRRDVGPPKGQADLIAAARGARRARAGRSTAMVTTTAGTTTNWSANAEVE